MKYFIIGIRGVGVVGIATLYKQWGHEVAGSDTEEGFFTGRILDDLQIPVVSFDPAHITADITRVIYSSAYREDHPQLVRARELGIPILCYADALQEIFNVRKGILVTGTHGKTTCTAMLGRVLEDAGLDPTVLVGGELVEWGGTARAGKSEWMVAEGDEYQAKILKLNPHIVLITNIEFDHPDFYKTEDEYRAVFGQLARSLPPSGRIIAHESVRGLLGGALQASVEYYSGSEYDGALIALGVHNRSNASGVLAVAEAIGIDRAYTVKALSQFRGTKRRMEFYTDADAPIVLMDDYAHHPTEIRATLAALKERYPKRQIIAAFQPHTYSRTKALLSDFASAFTDASDVVLLDIYSSARETERTITGEEFCQAVRANRERVFFAPTVAGAIAQIKEIVREPAVVVAMGAGDVWHIVAQLGESAKK